MRKFLNIFFVAVIALSSCGVVFAEEGDIEQFSYDFAPDIEGAEYYLTITDITDSTVTFHIEYVGAKLSYEYAIEEMTADLVGNKADFLWEDSWFNSGTGSIVINEGSADLKLIVTKSSDFNRGTIATNGSAAANEDGSITLTSVSSYGAAYKKIKGSVSALSNELSIYLNGEKLSFSQAPYIENGTTMVPMRAVFEALGAEVQWDQATKTAIAVKDGTELRLTMNCMVAYVNGTVRELSAAPVLAEGSAMIPLRFVSESFDCEVSYVESTRSIYINN